VELGAALAARLTKMVADEPGSDWSSQMRARMGSALLVRAEFTVAVV
jgi:hypothetical protein